MREEDPKEVVEVVELPKIERRVISNYRYSKKDKKYYALSMKGIFKLMQQLTEGWPKAIGEIIFVPIEKRLQSLKDQNDLFAWFDELELFVDWAGGSTVPGAVTKTQFFSYVKIKAQRFDAIETIPQYPELPNVCYINFDEIPTGYKGYFEKLISFFKPETEQDKSYLRAMFLTPLSGLPPGARPAFVLLGPTEDKKEGRGVGKTTTTNIMGRLYGAPIDFSPDVKHEDAAKRILTSGRKRLVRVDNVKDKLSSGSIESLITTEYISGHQMYVGDQIIPNLFTWIFTFNQVDFSTDMAQRAIPIRLARPRYSSEWVKRINKFVNENRTKIIMDGIEILKSKARTQIAESIRFPEWTEQVLSRCTEDADIIADITRRQEETDTEIPLVDQIEEIIDTHMSEYTFDGGMRGIKYDKTTAAYRVKRSLVVKWIKEEIPWMTAVKLSNILLTHRPSWLRSIDALDARSRSDGRSNKGMLGFALDGTATVDFGTAKCRTLWVVFTDHRGYGVGHRISRTVEARG